MSGRQGDREKKATWDPRWAPPEESRPGRRTGCPQHHTLARRSRAPPAPGAVGTGTTEKAGVSHGAIPEKRPRGARAGAGSRPPAAPEEGRWARGSRARGGQRRREEGRGAFPGPPPLAWAPLSSPPRSARHPRASRGLAASRGGATSSRPPGTVQCGRRRRRSGGGGAGAEVGLGEARRAGKGRGCSGPVSGGPGAVPPPPLPALRGDAAALKQLLSPQPRPPPASAMVLPGPGRPPGAAPPPRPRDPASLRVRTPASGGWARGPGLHTHRPAAVAALRMRDAAGGVSGPGLGRRGREPGGVACPRLPGGGPARRGGALSSPVPSHAPARAGYCVFASVASALAPGRPSVPEVQAAVAH